MCFNMYYVCINSQRCNLHSGPKQINVWCLYFCIHANLFPLAELHIFCSLNKNVVEFSMLSRSWSKSHIKRQPFYINVSEYPLLGELFILFHWLVNDEKCHEKESTFFKVTKHLFPSLTANVIQIKKSVINIRKKKKKDVKSLARGSNVYFLIHQGRRLNFNGIYSL